MSRSDAEETIQRVMTVKLPDGYTPTPLDEEARDFVYGKVWARPGLSNRDRRLVTLACVSAAGAPEALEDHVRATLNSGDLTLAELEEFTLHTAVYSGWPKARHLQGVIQKEWARIQQESDDDIES
ncbi:carboxymuconolactone decarboxylase family protein [Streptomyces sp. NPDC101776]|uniref:carboxymuconolactone decarboxylase family protein n=1 Tax=Streptomyces sp. NPDC101776 TaxID=3366146 RepID=UPI00380DB1DB